MGQVYVVDDDFDVRQSLTLVLNSVGYVVDTYPTADEFLKHDVSETPHCLIVDLLLPGMTGLDLCQTLVSRKSACAFVMITGNADVSSAVEAMRLGAVDFLEKPFPRQRMLNTVHQAIQRARADHQQRLASDDVATRLAALTSREREVFEAIATGLTTKEIAACRGISTRTVDVHRSRIVHKLDIASPLQIAHFISVLARPRRQSHAPGDTPT
jgi:two-component system response regulator FixJ